jgi:digeranylgeranylglycerophospholipid reductase
MAYDVVVVGAGPTGSRVAELAAKRKLKVALIDKKKEIGKPVQCAGLVSHRLRSILTDLPDNVIVNRVRRAKFISPAATLELKHKKQVYVIDREKLDDFLFRKAKRAGADVANPVSFRGYTKKQEADGTESLIVNTDAGKMQTKILVGADGPMSTVATRAGLMRPANMLTGVQVTVGMKDHFDPNAVVLFFGSNISPDFFGWVVPLSDKKARIGVAAKRAPVAYLKRLVEKRTGGEVSGAGVKPDVAGRINFGVMQSTVAERVMVVGDAAAQVKPFSGGGLVYGLFGAGYCANACIRAVHENDFSAEFFKREYERKWKSHLAWPIRRGMLYRKAMHSFDGEISNFRTNWILRIGNYLKSVLESFDMDLL